MMHYAIIKYETEQGIIEVNVRVKGSVITVKNLADDIDYDPWQIPSDPTLEFDMCEISKNNGFDSLDMLAILATLREDFDHSIITGSENQPNIINFLELP